jgi:hypothetical protein
MDKRLREGWKDFLEKNRSEESWFVTLHFVFHITKLSAEKRIRKWLTRIEQSLKQMGHISNRPNEGLSAIVIQVPSNTHAHLLVNAKGLGELETSRWEDRWNEIMGYKGATPTCKIYPAWKGPNGAASYMGEYFNLGDGSEIWFRGSFPRTSTLK